MKIQIVLAWLLFLIVFPNMSYSGSFKNAPRLPEPMVFDLVLPLGASGNEYKFNSLGQYNFKQHAAKINPEFEYAYADSYGIEVAFPMKSSELEAYKMALQGTFDFFNTEKFIHGWQYIGEYHKHNKPLKMNCFVYLVISLMKTGACSI